MSKPSAEYLNIVEKWVLGELPIAHMHMTLPQKFRARLAFEAYQLWTGNKQINASKVIANLAARDYAMLLTKAAEGDEMSAYMVSALGIKEGSSRTPSEISNDVYVLNWLVGRLNVDTHHLERAKVEDASDWLIQEGMKMGSPRSVESGVNVKMKLNHNFDERENPSENMPNTNINITGDVSVVKNRVNYTPEEKRSYARKYGLSGEDFTEVVEGDDGVWQVPDPGSEEDDEAPDVFDENIDKHGK